MQPLDLWPKKKEKKKDGPLKGTRGHDDLLLDARASVQRSASGGVTLILIGIHRPD